MTEEEYFVRKYVTRERIVKLLGKLTDKQEKIHKSTLIPRFLTSLHYDLIHNETYNFISDKNRVLNFDLLKQLIINKAKELTPELFGHQLIDKDTNLNEATATDKT